MACDPQTLINNSSCIACNIPTGMQVPVLIYLLCQIQSNGTSASSSQIFTEFRDSVTIGAVQRTLYSDVIPGATVTKDGQRIIGAYMVTASYGGTPYNATVVITLNGTNIFSQTLAAANPSTWFFQFSIVQLNTTTARCYVVLSRDYAAGNASQVVNITNTDVAGVDFTQPITLALLGTSSDAAQTVTAKQAYAQVLK